MVTKKSNATSLPTFVVPTRTLVIQYSLRRIRYVLFLYCYCLTADKFILSIFPLLIDSFFKTTRCFVCFE